MPATIQTIQTPKRARALDTSGNNNHGQIYSGRGLEFDGVSDHLAHTQTDALEEFTVAVWINVNAISDRQNIAYGGSGTAAEYISINNAATGQYDLQWHRGAWLQGGIALNINTWYRVVYIFKRNGSAGDYKAYVNGVEDTTGSFPAEGAGTITNGTFNKIGTHNAAGRFFDGMMSDYQIWNTSWTQSDVTYDYLNPEQLALNNGGTSLTESNLKLWYPMQDGHRGQQSYILDGANTGLGSELTPDLDFNSGWSDNATASVADSGTAVVLDSDAGSVFTSSDILTSGTTYKVVVAGSISANNLEIGDRTSVGSIAVRGTGFGTHYFTATNTRFHIGASGAATINITSLSVKPVNAKNHATTGFYGDNLIGDADECTFESSIETWANADATLTNPSDLGSEIITSDYADNGTFDNDNGNWDAYGTGAVLEGWNGSAGASGGGLTVNPGASDVDQGATLGTGYMATLVAGQTYKVMADIKGPAADLTKYFIEIGGVRSSTFTVTDDFVTYTKYIVATSDAALVIGNENENGSYFYIDNVSVKEIYAQGGGSKALKVVQTGTGWDSAYKIVPTVAGRTYYVDGWVMKLAAGAGQWTWRVGTAENNASLVGNQNSSDYGTWVNITGTFIATTTTSFLTILPYNGETSTDTLYIDNISVKEVGTASGWTDADQQLDIPQTALQSYNQLAWFDGQNGNDATLDSQIDTSTNNWSISFWVFHKDAGQTFDFVIGSGATKNISFDNNSARKLYYRQASGGTYQAISDAEIPQGEWVHIVITAIADTSITAYVNGVTQTTNSSMSATQLVIDRFMEGYTAGTLETLGSITEISYYDDVLTESEAQDLYNDGKAKSALDADGSGNLVGYWRNNGLAEWEDLKGSNDANTNGVTETLLLPAGVDSSRDNQGFIMNRQRDTNSLNLTTAGGTVSYVAIPETTYDVDGTACSFSFWIKRNSTINSNGTSNWNTILGNSGVNAYKWIAINTGYTQLHIEGDTNTDGAYATFTALTLDTWYNFAIVCNGSGAVAMYKNGVTTGMSMTDSSIGVNLTINQIGRAYDSTYESDAQLDDILIYDGKALSAPEVLRNYKAGKRSHR